MSQIKISSKPTLGLLLTNPQNDQSNKSSVQKVVFPKINTKLKKKHFTKYHSAFLSSQSLTLDPQSQEKQLIGPKQSFKKLNTQQIHNQRQNEQRLKLQLKKNIWKLNRSYNQSYSIKPNQKLNLNESIQKSQQNTNKKDKSYDNCINQSQIKSNQKFTLLTQIRQLNFSPIQHAQTSRPYNSVVKNKVQINQTIERSNKIISLIQKNYKKGFFQNRTKKADSLEKLQQKLGLFSYLKRGFVTKKQKLTSDKLKQYFKSPSNKNLQAKINYEARSFLKQKMHNDYKSYKQVSNLRQNISKDAIKQQIQQKNIQYHSQYNKKYNIPYLSFLSLPKNLKVKVLQNLTNDGVKVKQK